MALVLDGERLMWLLAVGVVIAAVILAVAVALLLRWVLFISVWLDWAAGEVDELADAAGHRPFLRSGRAAWPKRPGRR